MILRYWTEAEQARGEVLVVYRVAKDDSCQVAWIDALANTDAIAIARKIADRDRKLFALRTRQEPTPTNGA